MKRIIQHGAPPQTPRPPSRRGQSAASPVALLLVFAGVFVTTLAAGDPPVPAADGAKAFIAVASVLQSPRCMNCHPVGDAPLQTDHARPHAMNITRASVEAGLACATCHQTRNSEALGIKGGPPGAPKWGLPPKETPMVFQGLTVTQLCEQMKDPERNGHKDLAALFEHMDHDPLVLWGWAPGGNRTLPPLDHATFSAAARTWVASGGACP